VYQLKRKVSIDTHEVVLPAWYTLPR